MIVPINIGAGWQPDLTYAEIAKAGGLAIAKNIYPVNNKYLPVPDLVTFNTTAVAGTALRGISIYNTTTTPAGYTNFVGTTTKLYLVTSSVLTNLTRVAGDYTSTALGWNFVEYGTWLIALNGLDVVQVLKGLDSANFIALGGTPPVAKYGIMNSGHLILANTAASPKKIWWSALENVEDWTPSIVTGSDSQDFPEMMGVITGIVNLGDNFLITSEYSCTLGYFIGGSYVYGFRNNIIKNQGCFYPNSIISIGNKAFFWGKNAIFMVESDGNITNIGDGVNTSLFSDLNTAHANKISVAHDPIKFYIAWAYPRTGSTTPNRILLYNYLDKRFTYIDLGVDIIWTGATGGTTIDAMTTTLIDSLTSTSIDSNTWLSNTLVPMAIATADSKVKTFTGNDLTATIETGEYYNEPDILHVKKAYMAIEGLIGSATIIIKNRKSPIDIFTSSTGVSVKSDNTVDLRTTNRRLAVNLEATSFTSIGNEIKVDVGTVGGR